MQYSKKQCNECGSNYIPRSGNQRRCPACRGVPDELPPGWGSCRCGERWEGFDACHCATCHRTFADVAAFDAHRAACLVSAMPIDQA